MRFRSPRIAFALAALLGLPAAGGAAAPARPPLRVAPTSHGDVHVRTLQNGRISCREATPEEAARLSRNASQVPVHVISPVRTMSTPARAQGLTLTLRATTQLEANPEAKAAFLRAADTWMALIRNPVTVIIDVDFGATNFGTDFPPDVIGSTGSQSLGSPDLYPDLASTLKQHRPATPDFPPSLLPTDIGATQYGIAPSALFRAIDFIDPVADPVKESTWGNPPRIGFNSSIPWDFNPDDGISPSRYDFVATAVHEIGHVLGFQSAVGRTELDPEATVLFSVWDVFRFRPGVTAQTFPSVNRVLSSGGEQVFFEGSKSLALSTGRPDGTAGDGNQASHWKADEKSGTYIGIMDPTIAAGERDEITENDLLALEVMGWMTGSAPETGTSWILPSSARAPGAGGAFYSTALSVGNRGSAEARYKLKFLGNNTDGTGGPESAELVLGPNQAVTYTDVLGSVFNLPNGSFGAIRLTANVATLNVLGQTSTPDPTKPGGTFGQSVPAFGPSDLIPAGSTVSIVGIRQDGSFRTNLVVANGGTSAVTVTGTLLAASGAVIGTGTWTLPPLGMTQVTGLVGAVGGVGEVRDAQLLLTTSTTGGTFAAYAVVIDNVTNDPRTLLPK